MQMRQGDNFYFQFLPGESGWLPWHDRHSQLKQKNSEAQTAQVGESGSADTAHVEFFAYKSFQLLSHVPRHTPVYSHSYAGYMLKSSNTSGSVRVIRSRQYPGSVQGLLTFTSLQAVNASTRRQQSIWLRIRVKYTGSVYGYGIIIRNQYTRSEE